MKKIIYGVYNQVLSPPIKKTVTLMKYRFQRGYQWVGVIGIGFMVCAEIQRQLAKIGINVSMWVLFPLAIVGIWFVGWFEEVSGIFGIEQQHIWDKNPEYKQFRDKMVKDVEKDLEKKGDSKSH